MHTVLTTCAVSCRDTVLTEKALEGPGWPSLVHEATPGGSPLFSSSHCRISYPDLHHVSIKTGNSQSPGISPHRWCNDATVGGQRRRSFSRDRVSTDKAKRRVHRVVDLETSTPTSLSNLLGSRSSRRSSAMDSDDTAISIIIDD